MSKTHICPCRETCVLQAVTDSLGGKWKLPILCSLTANGPSRYNDLLRNMQGISNTMLAKSLKELERDGLVRRREYLEVPVRVEYSVTERTKAALDRFLAEGGEQPTQFEFITAMAFLYFAEKQVDYAVIEVGMGGLWDSTNIITPEVSVITNVTLEHTDRLGKTIEAIAAQKAGIIKPGVPVVTEAEGKALEVIRGTAEASHAPLYVYGDDFSTEELTSSMDAQTFLYRMGEKEMEVTIHLPGEHQILNGAAALAAAEILREKDGSIDEAAMLRGMDAARWPGRLERIHRNPDIILDGAHNPSGVTVLRKALDEYYPGARRIYVFGMMADKDVSQVSEILFRPEDTIYTVLAHEGDRSEKPEKLARRLHKNAVPMDDLTAAYRRAVQEAGPEDVVIVCGSLYLIGTFKELGLDR